MGHRSTKPQVVCSLAIQHGRNGFTLIEFAFVLVLVGLLIGMGAELLPLLVKQNKLKENRMLVREVRTALVGYATASGRLPYAASSENGVESIGRLSGYLPYAAIGIRGNDVYQKTLFYAVDPYLTETPDIDEFKAHLSELITGTHTPDLFCDSGSVQAAFIVLSSGENLSADSPNDDNSNGRIDIHDDNQFAPPGAPYSSGYDDILDAVSLTYLYGTLEE